MVHTILTLALDISSSDGAFATIAHNGEMTRPERAVMTQSQSAPSVPNLARENAAPADPAFVAKLQQAANLANENCDRATALAHTLSGQLREAQSRINQLELEADGLVERLRAEVETVVAKLQSDANARVERTKREAAALAPGREPPQCSAPARSTDATGGRAREGSGCIARVEAEARVVVPSPLAGRARTGTAAHRPNES